LRWELIESDQALLGALRESHDAPAVAIDTEFMRRNTFYPQVALLQLCFHDTAYLVDPLRIEDLQPLRQLLANTKIVKVLHSASEDLEVFQHWLGQLPQPLFDTQRAGALLDLGFGLGYRALVLDMCGVELPKDETRSDWLQRPLTEAQCEYAAQDVAWLLPIWHSLQERCIEQGKLDWVFADGEQAGRTLATAADGYFRKIKNAWKLDRCALQKLLAICDWREQQARSRDKPRGWIIDDKACMQLAQIQVTNRHQLAVDTDIPAGALRRYAGELIQLLQEQEQLPVSELPEPLPQPLSPPQRKQLKALKAHAKVLAQGLQSAPEALLPSREFETLVRESSGEQVDEPSHWRGWRAEHVIAPLRQYLAENV